jgi:hypothetical protein
MALETQRPDVALQEGGTVVANQGTAGVQDWLVTDTALQALITASIGDPTDAEAAGNGTVIALLKRLRTLLAGGLPSALVGGRLDVNVGALPALPAGTNNIGDVDVLTLPALPAGTNNIGDVDIVTLPALKNGVINVGGTELTINWIKINATSSGDNTIVAAVTSKKIRVIGIAFVCSNTVDISFKSGSTTKIDAMSFAKYGGMADNGGVAGYWLETASGEAFIMNLSGAVNVRGRVYYVEVP